MESSLGKYTVLFESALSKREGDDVGRGWRGLGFRNKTILIRLIIENYHICHDHFAYLTFTCTQPSYDSSARTCTSIFHI